MLEGRACLASRTALPSRPPSPPQGRRNGRGRDFRHRRPDGRRQESRRTSDWPAISQNCRASAQLLFADPRSRAACASIDLEVPIALVSLRARPNETRSRPGAHALEKRSHHARRRSALDRARFAGGKRGLICDLETASPAHSLRHESGEAVETRRRGWSRSARLPRSLEPGPLRRESLRSKYEDRSRPGRFRNSPGEGPTPSHRWDCRAVRFSGRQGPPQNRCAVPRKEREKRLAHFPILERYALGVPTGVEVLERAKKN